MDVHYLHWLMSTGLPFQSTLCQPCESTTGKMAPKEGFNFAGGPYMALTVSAHLSRPCIEILAICRYMYAHHNYFKLYYLCLLASLFKPLPPPTLPRVRLTHPLIYTCLTIMNSMIKIVKTIKNQPLCTCQVNCAKANR